jgi:hypothetical protein
MQTMLSTALAVFRGLQDHLRNILHDFPDDSPAQLRQGLVDAYENLVNTIIASTNYPFTRGPLSRYFTYLTTAI